VVAIGEAKDFLAALAEAEVLKPAQNAGAASGGAKSA